MDEVVRSFHSLNSPARPCGIAADRLLWTYLYSTAGEEAAPRGGSYKE